MQLRFTQTRWVFIPSIEGVEQVALNSTSPSARDPFETSRSASLDSTFVLACVSVFGSLESYHLPRVPFVSFFSMRGDPVHDSILPNTLLRLHSIRLSNPPDAPPLVPLGKGWQERSAGFLGHDTDGLVGSAVQTSHSPMGVYSREFRTAWSVTNSHLVTRSDQGFVHGRPGEARVPGTHLSSSRPSDRFSISCMTGLLCKDGGGGDCPVTACSSTGFSSFSTCSRAANSFASIFPARSLAYPPRIKSSSNIPL